MQHYSARCTRRASSRCPPAVLLDVSEHLWRAQDDLLSAGYGLWVEDLLRFLETVTLEIEWLSNEPDGT